MKELFFREPVISFFKNITLAMRKNPPFNIDFLVQEALNHPSPYVFLNKHIVEMVLYYYSRTELWGYKTIEIICKIMNYSRSYIHTSS